MTKTKQCLSLIAFYARTNPNVLFMLIAFAGPWLILRMEGGTFHSSLDSLLGVQNLFMVGIVGAWVLAPEMAQTGPRGVATISGTEFLLTRAIDRAFLYRTRVAFLYALVLLFPVVALIDAAFHPQLLVAEYTHGLRQPLFHFLPGSSLHADEHGGPPLILLPHGKLLVEAWHVWLFILATLFVQVLIVIVSRLPHRAYIFYGVFMAMVLLPLYFQLNHLARDLPTSEEEVFFRFVSHPWLIVLATLGAFLGVQRLCEHRFLRQEL